MKLIRLTAATTGEFVYVNGDRIMAMGPRERGGTRIELAGGDSFAVNVTDSIEQIIVKLGVTPR